MTMNVAITARINIRLGRRLSTGGKAGLILLIGVLLLAAAAPLICTHGPWAYAGPALSAPSRDHWLGTDDLGVDIWAQICFGARISILVGMGTALLAGSAGALAGILTGYRGGWTDRLLMRLIDILLVLPDLPVMIVLAAFFGPGVWTLIVGLSAFSWVFSARIVRARVMSLKQRRYIHAAEICGAGTWYLVRRHFLPEVFPLTAAAMIRLSGRAIVAEAGLSFLGLGDPAARSWGQMMHNALSFPGIYHTKFWNWWLLPPWIALTLVVTSLALLARDLEKAADPRMRTS
jgi:peptide/nickel transport system permease protein